MGYSAGRHKARATVRYTQVDTSSDQERSNTGGSVDSPSAQAINWCEGGVEWESRCVTPLSEQAPKLHVTTVAESAKMKFT